MQATLALKVNDSNGQQIAVFPSLSNSSLELRKQQMQNYLNKLLDVNDSSGTVIEFLEFDRNTNNPSMKTRKTIVDKFNTSVSVDISVKGHEIAIYQEKPKVYYKIEVHLKRGITNETYTLKKKYKDFKTFDNFLRNTFINDPDIFNIIPRLPVKMSDTGMKVPEIEMQFLLGDYLNDVIHKNEFNNLVCVKTFLSQGVQDQSSKSLNIADDTNSLNFLLSPSVG